MVRLPPGLDKAIAPSTPSTQQATATKMELEEQIDRTVLGEEESITGVLDIQGAGQMSELN